MALFDSPLGEPVDFRPPPAPEPRQLAGERVTLRPLDPDGDAGELYRISHPPAGDPSIWTYLYTGPYADLGAMRRDLEAAAAGSDPLFFVIVPHAGGRPAGVASYMRIEPEHGCIEIGNMWFAPQLQRTAAATEAIYLLARHAFDELGYRRLEWKCNALNAASRAAAERFGFQFEGVFRRHRVVKGRNRDTAWFAITDLDWPAVRAGFQAWLAPENFDAAGRQRRSLRELRPPRA